MTWHTGVYQMIETDFAKKIDGTIKNIDWNNINDDDTRIKLDKHPCHGYEAETTYLCIKIENIVNANQSNFDSFISYVMNEPNTNDKTEMVYRSINHIHEKYEVSIDNILKRINDLHNGWQYHES